MGKLSPKQAAQEVLKCSSSFTYFLENYCYFNTGAGFGKLDLAERQRELAETLVNKHNVLVLGSRQTGKTTIMTAYCAWIMLFYPGMSITFISRKEEQAKAQLQDIADLYERLPDFLKPTLQPNQATVKRVSETGSEIRIESVNNDPETKGRGIRSHIIWIDEAAFLKTLDPLLTGLIPTTAQRFQMAKKHNLPYGIIMTTTPNGVEGIGKAFFRLWDRAVKAEENNEGYSFFVPFRIHWSTIPFYDEAWYEEEKRKLGPEKTREFHQEYDLVFLGARDSFLPDDLIESLMPDVPLRKIDGFAIYEDYDSAKHYIIAIDPASEFGSADSAIEILNTADGTQVAEFVGKLPIYSNERDCLINKIKKAIHLYPNCLVIFESNGLGNQLVEQLPLIDDIKDKLYYKDNTKKPGVISTQASRQAYFSIIYSKLKDNIKSVKSHILISQLIALGVDKKGKIGKTNNNKDDAVLAYGIGNYIRLLLKDKLNINDNSLETDKAFVDQLKFIRNLNKKPKDDNNLAKELKVSSIHDLNDVQGWQNVVETFFDVSQFTKNLK